jgi:hypothetical protein
LYIAAISDLQGATEIVFLLISVRLEAVANYRACTETAFEDVNKAVLVQPRQEALLSCMNPCFFAERQKTVHSKPYAARVRSGVCPNYHKSASNAVVHRQAPASHSPVEILDEQQLMGGRGRHALENGMISGCRHQRNLKIWR